MTIRRRTKLRAVGLLTLGVAALGVAATAYAGSTEGVQSIAAAPRCLVATGSGDPAFVRNFNPYVQGLPSSSFVRGGIYEPLVITTPAGGGKEYKWLARSYPDPAIAAE